MKSLLIRAAFAAFLGLALASPAYSSPVSATIAIDLDIPPGQTTLSFPNVYDPLHGKELTLDITLEIETPSSLQSAGVVLLPPTYIRFDWIDAAGNPAFSTPIAVNLSPDRAVTYSATYLIPFCPQEVSVDFDNPGDFVVHVKGTFTHTCLVPDTASCSGVLGLLVLGHWWRRRKILA